MPNLGVPEMLIILLVLVMLFGAKKLPELARGSGRALRIFKAETKGLVDDDEDDDQAATTTPTATSQAQISPTPAQQAPPAHIYPDTTVTPQTPPTHVEK